MGIITLVSDFGLEDGYVAAMKGVIASIAPEARLVDVTHLVPPQDVAFARFRLLSVARFFPVGTVHLAVVDPGVGRSAARCGSRPARLLLRRTGQRPARRAGARSAAGQVVRRNPRFSRTSSPVRHLPRAGHLRPGRGAPRAGGGSGISGAQHLSGRAGEARASGLRDDSWWRAGSSSSGRSVRKP